MQSATEENSCDGASGVPTGSMVQVCFPNVQTSVLNSLNRQREDGQLCDLSIHVQGHMFKAHRCVLAASSPYFHDQVLLKNMSTVSIPAVMDPLAFERVLSCAYTGQLQMLREDIVNYLTIGSVLQMWHIVDKCTELLKEDRGGSSGPQGTTPSSESTRCSGIANRDSYGGGGGGGGEGLAQSMVQPLNRPSMIESQSPSSTNYFSPKDASFGGTMPSTGTVGDGGMHSTPNYCMPSSREDAFLIDEEEEEDDELVYPRKQEQGSGRRKKSTPASDQEMGVSDSFGVSSYQDIESSPPQKRPMYSQPSIMPRKQWVVVKTERSRDDDFIVVSGEEGGENEDEQELDIAKERERERTFNISNVRTLSSDLSSREEIEAQVDYCQSPEDYLKFESGLMDQTSSQHSLENPSQSTSRAVSALLNSVQTAAARTQLFPLDMQGNQILLYNQASPTVGLQEALPGVSLKGAVEHGTVHLSGQGGMDSGLDGLDGNGAGATGKVFMCHCGKRFTHKSMRDRHINMHLDLRPFHCPVCSKKFKMKHHLTEHMKTHTGLKPYDCLSCGKKFMWRDSFMRHRSHCERHGGISGNSEAHGPEGSVVSPQNPLQHQQSGSKGSQGSVGGRSGIPVLSPHHSSSSSSSSSSRSGLSMPVMPGSLIGINPQSGMYGHGSGVLGLEVSQSECGDDISEVCIGENSIT